MASPLDDRLPIRFWAKVRINPVTGCWEWHGTRHPQGHGMTTIDGKPWYVHRLTYSVFIGPIPKGKHLHHTCHNQPCCNPEHVTPLTPGEHATESHAVGGRQSAKEACPQDHPYSPENTRTERRADGGLARRCLTCEADRALRRRTMPVGTSTRELGRAGVCSQGHDLTNAYVKPNGSRSCRECAARRAREARS